MMCSVLEDGRTEGSLVKETLCDPRQGGAQLLGGWRVGRREWCLWLGEERLSSGISTSGRPVKCYYSRVSLMAFVLKSLLACCVCSPWEGGATRQLKWLVLEDLVPN